MEAFEIQQKSMKIAWKSVKIFGNLQKSMEIKGNQCELIPIKASTKHNEHQQKPIQIVANQKGDASKSPSLHGRETPPAAMPHHI